MRSLIYYVGVTLDGYVAGPNHEVEFFPVSEDHVKYMATSRPEVLPTPARDALGCSDAPNRTFDTVVMGRTTYDQGAEQGLTDPYAHLDTYVVTRRAGALGDGGVNVTDDPQRLVEDLRSRPGKDIWLAGGGLLAGALVDEIDQLITKVYPVIAGRGRPVLDGDFRPTAFDFVDERSFSSGCVERTFTRSRA